MTTDARDLAEAWRITKKMADDFGRRLHRQWQREEAEAIDSIMTTMRKRGSRGHL